MSNPYERAARLEKAIKLAEVFRALEVAAGATDAEIAIWLRALPDLDWRRAALLAGCQPPSVKTKALVIRDFSRSTLGVVS